MSSIDSTINKLATATTKSILKNRPNSENTSERNPQAASRIPLKAKVKFDQVVTKLAPETSARATIPKDTKFNSKFPPVRNFCNFSLLDSWDYWPNKQSDSSDNLLLNRRTPPESETNLIEHWTADETSLSAQLLSIRLDSGRCEKERLNYFDILEAGPSYVPSPNCAPSKPHSEVPEQIETVTGTVFSENLAAFNKRLEDIESSFGTDTTTRNKSDSAAAHQESVTSLSQSIHDFEHELSDEATSTSFHELPNNNIGWKSTEILNYWKQLAQDYTVGLLKVDPKPVEKLSDNLRKLDEKIKSNTTKAIDVEKLSSENKSLNSHSSEHFILTPKENFDATDNSEVTEYLSLDNSEATEEAVSLIEPEIQLHLPTNIELNQKSSLELSIRSEDNDKEKLQIIVDKEELHTIDKAPTEQKADNSFYQELINQRERSSTSECTLTHQESSEDIAKSSSPASQDSNRNLFEDFNKEKNLNPIPGSNYSKNSLQSGDKSKKFITDTEHFWNTLKSNTSKTEKLCFDQESRLQSGDKIVCYSTEFTARSKRFPLAYQELDERSTQFIRSLKALAAEKCTQQGQHILESKIFERTQDDSAAELLKSTTGLSSGNQQEASNQTEITQDNTWTEHLKSTCSGSSQTQSKSEGETVKTQDSNLADSLKSVCNTSENQSKPESESDESTSSIVTESLQFTLRTSPEIQHKPESGIFKTEDNPSAPTSSTSPERQSEPQQENLENHKHNILTEPLNSTCGTSQSQSKAESGTVKTQDNTSAEPLRSLQNTSFKNQSKPASESVKTEASTAPDLLKSALGTFLDSQHKPEGKTVKTENNTLVQPSKPDSNISSEEQPKSKSLDSVNNQLSSKLIDELIYELKECGGTTRTNISKINPGSEEVLLKEIKLQQTIPLKSSSVDNSSSEVHQAVKKTPPTVSKPPQDPPKSNEKPTGNVRNKVSFSLKEEVAKKNQKLDEVDSKASSLTKQESAQKGACLKSQQGFVDTFLALKAVGQLQTIKESEEKSCESICSRFESKSVNKDPVLAKSFTGNCLQVKQQVQEKPFRKSILKINTPSKSNDHPIKKQKNVGKVAVQNPFLTKRVVEKKPVEHSYVCKKTTLKLEGGVQSQNAVIEAIKENSPIAIFLTNLDKPSTSKPKKDLATFLKELSNAYSKSAVQFEESAKNIIINAPKSVTIKSTPKTVLNPTSSATTGGNNKTIKKGTGKNQKTVVEANKDCSPANQTELSKAKKNISVFQNDKTKGLYKPPSQIKTPDVSRTVLGTHREVTPKAKPQQGTDSNHQVSTKAITNHSKPAEKPKTNKASLTKINQKARASTPTIPAAESESGSSSKSKNLLNALPKETPKLCSQSPSDFNRAAKNCKGNLAKAGSQIKLKRTTAVNLGVSKQVLTKPGILIKKRKSRLDSQNSRVLVVKQKSLPGRNISATRSEPSASSSKSLKRLSVASKEITQVASKSATHIKQEGKAIVNFSKKPTVIPETKVKQKTEANDNFTNVTEGKGRRSVSPKPPSESIKQTVKGTAKPSKGVAEKPKNSPINVVALRTPSSLTKQLAKPEVSCGNLLRRGDNGYTATFLVKVASRSIGEVTKPVVVTKTLAEAQEDFRKQFEIAKIRAANSFDKARKLIGNVVDLARRQSDSIASDIGLLNNIISKATEKIEVGFETDRSYLDRLVKNTQKEVSAVLNSAKMGRCKEVEKPKQNCNHTCEKSKTSSVAEFKEQIQKGFDDAKAKAKETVESTLQHINEAIDKAKTHAESALDQAMEVKSNAGKSIKEAKQQMRKEFEEVYSQADLTAKQTIQQIEKTIDSVKEKTLDQVKGVKDSAVEVKGDLQKRLEEMKRKAEETVEKAKCDLNEIINNVRVKSEQALEDAKKRTQKAVKCYRTPDK